MKRSPLKVGSVTIGGGKPAFILGPCVIESEKFVWRMARQIEQICKAESVPFIFKASYDKANRTSVRSYRGLGVEDGRPPLALSLGTWSQQALVDVEKCYPFPEDKLTPSPRQEVPLWIGSWGSEAGLRRVARLADGWLSS